MIQDQFEKERQRLQVRIAELEAQLSRSETNIASLQAEVAAAHAAASRAAHAPAPVTSSPALHSVKSSKGFTPSGSVPNTGPLAAAGSVVVSSTGGAGQCRCLLLC